MNKKNVIPIVLSSDNKFVPQLYVCLASLIKHSTKQYIYHIFILHTEIEEYTQQIFINGLTREQVQLEFINVTEQIASYVLKDKRSWTVAVYYRLLIPELFQDYEKVMYLDADLLICRDIAELYESTLKENNSYLAAAAEDMNVTAWEEDQEIKSYLKETLGIDTKKKPFYFNSGVMVYHIPNIRRVISVEKLLKMAENFSYQYVDQDILNKVFADKIQWLDIRWNYFPVWDSEKYRPDLQKEILAIRKQIPYIIHYAGPKKPWNATSILFGELWWSTARETPFYERIVKEYLTPIFQQTIEENWHEMWNRYRLEKLRGICKKIPLGGGIRKCGIAVYEWMRKRAESKERT